MELLYARSAVVNAAKSFGLQAIDLVCIDYKNLNQLEKECLNGKSFGFTGKQAIHPDQVELINSIFTPSKEEISWALEVVKGYQEHCTKGVGAFNYEGKVIDLPVVKIARKILIQAGMT